MEILTTTFLTEVFTGKNLVFSLPLILILLYWISVIIGILDIDIFDIDIDHMPSGISQLLGLVGIEKGIPISVSLSIFILPYTLFGLSWHHWLQPIIRDLALPLSIIGAIGPAMLVSFIVQSSIQPHMEEMRKQSISGHDFIGQSAKITSSRVTPSFGEALLVDLSGVEHLIQIRSTDGNFLQKGESVFILEFDQDRLLYHVDSSPMLLNEKNN